MSHRGDPDRPRHVREMQPGDIAALSVYQVKVTGGRLYIHGLAPLSAASVRDSHHVRLEMLADRTFRITMPRDATFGVRGYAVHDERVVSELRIHGGRTGHDRDFDLRRVRVPAEVIGGGRSVADLTPGDHGWLASGAVSLRDGVPVVHTCSSLYRTSGARTAPIRVEMLADGSLSVSVPHDQRFRTDHYSSLPALTVSEVRRRGLLGWAGPLRGTSLSE